MREIVVDTETTGLDALQGHKIVEIGCVELQRLVPTGKEFHRYINPERDIPESARAIHGIDEKFVKTMPRFADLADELLEFFGDATLVIHNAPFDMAFLNTELEHCGKPPLANAVCDTLLLAQDRFRGERVGLDALCRRYGIDLSARQRHGALIDARLLAQVYLELCGGRQQGMGLVEPELPSPVVDKQTASAVIEPQPHREKNEEKQAEQQGEQRGEQRGEQQGERRSFRVLLASDEERKAHLALLAKIGKSE